MTSIQSYDALLAVLEQQPGAGPDLFLGAVKDSYKLNHVVYADLVPALEGYRVRRLLHDDNAALSRYLARHGVSALASFLDAVFDHACPFEISPGHDPKLPPSTRRILRECGLLPCAVFFPLASPQGRKAFFSAHASAGEDAWKAMRKDIIRDIPSLATQFHGTQIATPHTALCSEARRQKRTLTPREREALGWAAAGKNYWEIATIMGISERTVRHFMANVRLKLDAVSNKQAVAEAVLQGLIARTGTSGR